MSQNFGVRQLAREIGFSPAYVSRCLSKGESPDTIRARAARKTLAMPLPGAPRGKQDETFASAQRRKEVALADQREMENAQRRGELVNRSQISNFLAAAILSAKDVILHLSEFADRWSSESDPYVIRMDIEREAYRALGELEAAWRKLALDAVEPEPEPIPEAVKPAVGPTGKSSAKKQAKRKQ